MDRRAFLRGALVASAGLAAAPAAAKALMTDEPIYCGTITGAQIAAQTISANKIVIDQHSLHVFDQAGNERLRFGRLVSNT